MNSTKFNLVMKSIRQMLSEIDEEDYFKAAIQISADRWMDDRGYDNHLKTCVMTEILEGFELQEADGRE